MPEDPITLLLPLALAVVAMVGVLWRVTRFAVTITHEGGHALAAVLTGRRLSGIRLHADTSGVTLSRGPARGAGMVLTILAGYPASALAGLVVAGAVAAGWASYVLWVAVVGLAVMLLAVRNAVGVVVVLAAGGGVLAITRYATDDARVVAVQALAWFLLLGSVRAVGDLGGTRRGSGGTSDADQLARLTGVPATAWVAAFWVFCVASVVVGGSWLVPPQWLPHWVVEPAWSPVNWSPVNWSPGAWLPAVAPTG